MAAMALMLAVNFSANAQLGGALNRVRQAAQKATQAVDAATGNNSAGQNSGNPITEAASTAASAAGVPAAAIPSAVPRSMTIIVIGKSLCRSKAEQKGQGQGKNVLCSHALLQ